MDYEGDARLPPWLEGLEGMEGGEDGEGYAALRVAPVLRALVRHVLAGAGAGGGLPVGKALEEGMLAFLESWAGGEVGMVAAGTEEDAEAAGVAAAVPEELAAVSAAPLGGDVTLLVLGLGGAGKSTVVAALQGEADAQVVMVVCGFGTDLTRHYPTTDIRHTHTNLQPAPTTGFHPHTAVLAAGGADKQQEQQERQQRLLHLHDVGGAEAIRGIWPSYYHDAHGVVWVTACADMVGRSLCLSVAGVCGTASHRLTYVHRSQQDAWRAADLPLLRECLAHPFLAGKPLLVLLNHRAGADAGAEPLVTADALREELLQQVAATAIDPSLLRVQACVAHAGGGNGGAGAIDARIEEGVAWLVGAVGLEGAALRARVRGDTAATEAALAAALAWKDRELLRALLEKAAAMVGGDGVGAEAGEREEGVLSKEQVGGRGLID